MATLFERVIDFMKDRTDVDLADAGTETQMVADLGLNSLTMIELANDAETEFDVVIEDDELTKLVTIGDIVALLEKKGVEG